MSEYFAVTSESRKGPFQSMQEAGLELKEISRERGDTDEEAEQFFLLNSQVVEVTILDGQVEMINVGWRARELSGRQ